MTPRTVLRSLSIQPQDRGGGFIVAQPLHHLDVDTDPFLLVDWGRMDRDPFGPHPHAGFSAVTWLLPFSEGSIRNRDSLGDDSVFGPGSIHWFEAAHGAVHNETPIGEAELLQIFVNLPQAKKHEEAKTYRGTAEQLPVVPVGDSKVRVVVGSFEGRTSPVVPRTLDMGILHVDVDGTVTLPLPRGHNVVVITTRGSVDVNGTDDNVVALADDGDGVVLKGKGHTTILHGKPLQEPVVAAGPFVMGSRAELADAIHRYNSGAMGSVEELVDDAG